MEKPSFWGTAHTLGEAQVSLNNMNVNNVDEFQAKRKTQAELFEYSLKYREKVYKTEKEETIDKWIDEDPIYNSSIELFKKYNLPIPVPPKQKNRYPDPYKNLKIISYHEDTLEYIFIKIIKEIEKLSIEELERTLLLDSAYYLLKTSKQEAMMVGKTVIVEPNGFKKPSFVDLSRVIKVIGEADISEEALLSTEKDLYGYAIESLKDYAVIPLSFHEEMTDGEMEFAYIEAFKRIGKVKTNEIPYIYSALSYVTKINKIKIATAEKNKEKRK
jgi:hypothetical protein